ncbi:MAG: MogA/MoaB family molybdenum cofactor biosynthesis protein [Polyangiaceae bacterium]|nr:MogA/MoaB family molybdenum cofactor biosynthesis protein [Polyangiaceae bacterium]
METPAPKEGRKRVVVATLTLSDTRTEADDEGGKLLRSLLAGAGFDLGAHAIVREDVDRIREAVRALAGDDGIDAIVTTGGTGLAPRDVTLTAIESLFDKPMVGFGEAFRRLSWDDIGPRAMLSNAAAGVVAGKIVIALPGSPKAIDLAVPKLVAPVLGHAVDVARGRARHHHGPRHGGT